MADLAQLQAAHDRAAEAIGAFEARQAEVLAQLKNERKVVNDAYRAADAALQDAQNETKRLDAAQATIEAAGGQVVRPDGVAGSAAAGEVG